MEFLWWGDLSANLTSLVHFVDSDAGSYFPDRKVDVADSQYDRVAPRDREKIVLIENEATSQ